MPVTLAALIKIAPFKQEARQDLLARLDKLSEEQKTTLSDTCWTVLSQMYYAKLRYEQEMLMLEIQEGKRKFNKKDFEEVEKKVTEEFVQKLKAAQTRESVEEIREELKKHFRKPKAS